MRLFTRVRLYVCVFVCIGNKKSTSQSVCVEYKWCVCVLDVTYNTYSLPTATESFGFVHNGDDALPGLDHVGFK